MGEGMSAFKLQVELYHAQKQVYQLEKAVAPLAEANLKLMKVIDAIEDVLAEYDPDRYVCRNCD